MASKNPLGHGSIRNADSRGRLVHTATVSTFDSHGADLLRIGAGIDVGFAPWHRILACVSQFTGWKPTPLISTPILSPANSLILTEATTRYDGRGRPVASTTWLSARNAIDPTNPPIAGWNGVSTNDGLTTQYLYDENLTDASGLSSSTGVTVNKLSGSGTYNVSFSNAITKLASTQANGGAGISFNSDSPGRATVVINGEEEIGFTITDGIGRTVMSGQLDNYKGTQNALLAWSTQLHDTVTNISGYGDCLETKSIDALGKATRSLVDGAGRTMRTIDQLSDNTNITYDAAGNQLTTRDPNSVSADMVYDQLNRNTSRTNTSGDTTSSQYDRIGNARVRPMARAFTLTSPSTLGGGRNRPPIA